MNYQLTDKALNALGKIFVDVLKKRIRAKIYPFGNPSQRGIGDKVASGELYNSISFKVVKGETGEPSLLEISWADYFEYVNVGRLPGARKVPIKALLSWIKLKGLRFRDKRGRYAKGSQTQLAFAIQTNIYKFGIRPKKRGNLFYDPSIDQLEQLLENPPAEYKKALDGVWNALEKDINNLLEQTITKKI